jgi:hypothetical protein
MEYPEKVSGSTKGRPVRRFDELEERKRRAMERSDQTYDLHRYRRYRVIGLLSAVIILAGGLYLGVADGSWIPFLAGVLFFLVCSLMIASDRKGNKSKKAN